MHELNQMAAARRLRQHELPPPPPELMGAEGGAKRWVDQGVSEHKNMEQQHVLSARGGREAADAPRPVPATLEGTAWSYDGDFCEEMESMCGVMERSSVSEFGVQACESLCLPSVSTPLERCHVHGGFSVKSGTLHGMPYLYNSPLPPSPDSESTPGLSEPYAFLQGGFGRASSLPRRHSYANGSKPVPKDFMHYRLFSGRKRDFV